MEPRFARFIPGIYGMSVAPARSMTKSQRQPYTALPRSEGRRTATATLDRDRVAQRAYELYLERGGKEGRDLDNWLDAERELSEEERPRDGS